MRHMEIKKSQLTVDGNHLSFAVPFEKVDTERRLVSGWATLNNIDSQRDVVTTEASIAAFEKARGNIREMHEPKAVGRLVDFKVDTLIHEDGSRYEGIYVTAFVSKGAQDTWEKVLDGTLSGFSIGGNITESESQWVKDANSAVRFVKAYDLIELSLVDNPANPLANIFSIQKSEDGTTMIKGMITEVETENAFLCRNHDKEIARTSKEDNLDCLLCGSEMEPMGWVETAGDMTKAVVSLMNKYLTPDANEGGVESMDTQENVVETEIAKSEVVDPEAVEVPVEAEAEVDEADENDAPVEEDDTDIEKMVNDVRDSVEEQINRLEAKIEEVSKSASIRMDELGNKFSEAMQKFESANSVAEKARKEVEMMTKRLEAVEGKGAIRKSAEVEAASGSDEPSNIWTGAFDLDL